MNSITFKCEIITPMFLAGADGAKLEIRPPSIKGALRFWWRAMHGHLPIDDFRDGYNIQKGLRTQEAEIFGGTDEKVGRSKMIIRTSHPQLKVIDQKPLPHHTGEENCPYLNCKKEKWKNGKKIMICTKGSNGNAIEIKLDFLVTLSLTSLQHNFDIEKLKSLFILTCLLGGLGKRSRRGFGSFRITDIKKNDQIYFESFEMPTTLEDILPYLTKFNNDYQLDNDKSPSKIHLTKSAFPERKYPYIEEIKIGSKPYSSYSNLVTRIGKSSHDNQDKSNGYATPRFASPTYVSAIMINNRYFPIITSLHICPKKIKKVLAN